MLGERAGEAKARGGQCREDGGGQQLEQRSEGTGRDDVRRCRPTYLSCGPCSRWVTNPDFAALGKAPDIQPSGVEAAPHHLPREGTCMET